MMEKAMKPMKKTILRGTVCFILLLCVILSVAQYAGNKAALYAQYEQYLGGVLRYAAADIDADDLAECIRTGVKSEKYGALQTALDKIRENTDIHFIYIIVPLNVNPVDNMKNVIAGATRHEYEFEVDKIVQLNSLTGDSYSARAAKTYLNAYNSGTLTFFESGSERGDVYTGLLPLFDAKGNAAAALCVDADAAEIHGRLRSSMIVSVILAAILGGVFLCIIVNWTRRKVSDPIEQLGTSVMEFTSQCGSQKNPKDLELEVPLIQTHNEVEMLANALSQMGRSLREYVRNTLETERETARVSILVNTDPLTGVRNKNAFSAFIHEKDEMIRAAASEPFMLVIAGLNGVKNVNEACGSAQGDEYIKKACRTICGLFSYSPVFRIGDEDFIVILSGKPYDERDYLLRQARNAFYAMEGNRVLPLWERCSAAIGAAEYDVGKDHSFTEVLERAEENMRQVKAKLKAEQE